MLLQIKRQPLNLEELVKKSFRWHFLPSEFVSLSQTKQFASISIDLEIEFCLKTNLDFFPWQIPQRQTDGASLGICRIESLICRNSTQLDFNRTICRWKSWHGAHYSTQIRRKNWINLESVARSRFTIGHLATLVTCCRGASCGWEAAPFPAARWSLLGVRHCAHPLVHDDSRTASDPLHAGPKRRRSSCPAAACLTTKLLNYSRQPANNAGKPSPSQSQKFPMRETAQVLTEEEANVKLEKRSLGRSSELNAPMKQGQN